LPDLKRAGKIVIVISHDDRYFGHADKVIMMENGKIINSIHNGRAEPVLTVHS
jgi:putative ATP-binding cassette transporter